MTSRFIALPVGQGDAFYLQRDDFHILVDGGRSKRNLSGLLTTHIEPLPPQLDVVVCTHNDADHANGLLGLLKELPVSIREVWLPGTWAWRLEDLVTRPYEFFHELYKNISELRDEVETLQQYYEKYWKRLPLSIQMPETTRIPDHGIDADEWLTDVFDRQDFSWRHWRKYWWFFDLPYPSGRLWLECLDAAHRIRSIAEAALNAGARIRLFEFVQSPNMTAGGYRWQLEPVNSREVWPRKEAVSALFFLALTKANRESLVFYAPEQIQKNAPGVLFTADSDLGCRLNHIQQPSRSLIATAPHHGSEANALAYTVINGWTSPDKVIWVRSDCRNKSRPGDTFKNQPKRLCTLCNIVQRPKSSVRLHAIRSRWERTRGTRWCTCR